MKKVLGIGAALVDLLSEVGEDWVNAQGCGKGGMTLVDWPRMESMLASLPSTTKVPGGSACNTIRGLARLGGSSAFRSRVGKDELADVFVKSLQANGVESRLLESNHSATGCVLSAVTPDAQRSMYTFLGASLEMGPSDINAQALAGIGMVYLEGYIAYNGPWFSAVVSECRRLGIPVALDFGSFNVVQDCRTLLDATFAAGTFEVLIANEDEAKAFTGLEGEEALRKMAPFAKICVVKLGKDGALILKDGKVSRVKAQQVKAIDTTGAGDLWAAGFLFGLLQSWDMEKCGNLASAVAAEVVQVMGPVIPESGWARLLRSL